MRLNRLWPPVAFAFALLAATWIMLDLTRQMHTVSVAWPMDAVITAFLVRWAKDAGERRLVFALALPALVAANLFNGSGLAQALGMCCLNGADIAFATWLVRKVGNPIDSLKAFAAFVAGAVLASPAVTGLGAGALFAITDPSANAAQVALRWFCAAGLGMVIVGAVALSVRAPRRDEPRRAMLQFLAGQTVMLAGVCFILLRHGAPPLFLLAPFLVVGAVSHREMGGICAVALTAVVVWGSTILGMGPAAVADLASVDPILLMQIVLASVVFTVLPISALLRRLDMVASELRERQARAEEMNALKTRLLGYVSHEIRSPLSGVTALAELMRDGALGELTAEQRESLNRIVATGAEVDQLARDLTDTAAIQAGKARVTIQAVQVDEAIRSAVAAARFRTAGQAAEIGITGPLDGGFVAADPLRLRQILVNLMVNGAKYGGRPAKVWIQALRTSGGAVRFEVIDNGAGVPVERRADLFKAFERLGAETSALEGSGLGLALSHEIARLQNGTLGVGDEDLGCGLFWLELPVCAAAAEAA